MKLMKSAYKYSSAKRAIRLIVTVVFVLQVLISCGGIANDEVPRQTGASTVNSSVGQKDESPQDQATICNRIPDIKVYPFHGNQGIDPAYDAFMNAGDAAIPCLIKKITDTRHIPDPGETLKFPETTVGEIAYFLLIDITKISFAEFLPKAVQEDYKANGVWAYYEYVKTVRHRKDLQIRFYDWYQRKSGRDIRQP